MVTWWRELGTAPAGDRIAKRSLPMVGLTTLDVLARSVVWFSDCGVRTPASRRLDLIIVLFGRVDHTPNWSILSTTLKKIIKTMDYSESTTHRKWPKEISNWRSREALKKLKIEKCNLLVHQESTSNLTGFKRFTSNRLVIQLIIAIFPTKCLRLRSLPAKRSLSIVRKHSFTRKNYNHR